MSKNKLKKKRDRTYAKSNTKLTARPNVHRYAAALRSPRSEWWHEKKPLIKASSIAFAVVAFFVWMISELFKLAF